MKTLFYQGKEIELNYSTTLNHLIPHQLWQCGLSLPALGLAGYLYTLPKQWRLSVTHLSKQLAMSKNTCRKYLKEIFSNEKAREVFKVKEAEINTYDFEEGFTAYDYASDKEELENFTSSVAKDVSKPNKKRVMIIQTQRQRYLLNLCFKGIANNSAQAESNQINGARKACNLESVVGGLGAKGVKKEGGIRESSLPIQAPLSPLERTLSQTKLESSHTAQKVDSNAPKNAQNLNTINKNLLQDSYKDSSSKRTREKSNNDLTSFLDLQSFNQNEQEAIKLWIRYKQESTRKPFKPSQVDFQLRKITKLKEQGQDICAVIEKSLDMGWAGLFAMPSTPQAERFAMRNRGFQGAGAGIYLGDNEQARAAESTIYRAKLTPKMPKNIGAKALLCVK